MEQGYRKSCLGGTKRGGTLVGRWVKLDREESGFDQKKIFFLCFRGGEARGSRVGGGGGAAL